VKWGVRPGSYTFRNELFGPLLAVVRIENLRQGIEYINSIEYGLTSGLQTLDESEQKLWRNSIEAGNLYINRGITGAIVNRQPFGGMKLSTFGGGVKAGGPNYVTSFLNIVETGYTPSVQNGNDFLAFSALLDDNDKARFESAIDSYQKNWETEFSQERKTSDIIGEENIFRYSMLKRCALRVQADDKLCDVLMVIAASLIAQTIITVSVASDDPKCRTLINVKTRHVTPLLSVVVQDEASFVKDMAKYERIRTCSSDLSEAIYKQTAALGKYIATAPPLAEGRVEMLHYMKEQTISFEYHRYGSITE
jgi:RHH-type proline utilization regulon transcriptional repressor/proline dehydrogenase/delta 1-pyrroline-5-carboxylate dehydrogenase